MFQLFIAVEKSEKTCDEIFVVFAEFQFNFQKAMQYFFAK